MKTSRFALFAILGGLAFFPSCAKDRDQEQYQREELQRRLNIYDSISGNYEGRSQSRWTGEGAKVRIELWSEIRTVPGEGTRETQERPELLVKLYFAAEVQVVLVFRNASFDESKRVLNAETTLLRGDGSKEDVKLNATVTSTGIRGTLGTLDYFDYGYNFEIEKNADANARFVWPELRRDQLIPGTINLEGKGTWGSLENKQAEFSLLLASGTMESQLLLLLSPIRYLRGSLGFDYRTIDLSYQMLIWDSRVGQITGAGAMMSSGNTINYSIDCIENRRPDLGRFEVGDLECAQVISTRGGIARFKFAGSRP